MEYLCLQNVDVKKIMSWVAEFNTVHYKMDLPLELERIQNFEPTADQSNNFFFLSKMNGVNLFPEREVFLKDTVSYQLFQVYAQEENNGLLYYVELKFRENDCFKGDMTQLDFSQVAELIRNHAQQPTHVLVDSTAFETPHSFPFEDYVNKRKEIDYILAPFDSVEYQVKNEHLLQSIIAYNREEIVAQREEVSSATYFEKLEDRCRELYQDISYYEPFAYFTGDLPENIKNTTDLLEDIENTEDFER